MIMADFLVCICFYFLLFLGLVFLSLVWWIACLLQDNLEQSIPHYIQSNSSRIPMLAKYIVDLIIVALSKKVGLLLFE